MMKGPEQPPEDDWIPFKFPASYPDAQAFVAGDPNEDRIRVRYYCRPQDNCVVGTVWFGRAAMGPPGHVHGGAMAAVLDEAMGAVVWQAGHIAVAGKLSFKYKAMMELESSLRLETEIVKKQGKLITTTGRLFDLEGTTYVTAEGLFVEVDRERFK
jgi:acyl-coenzyme A thioesterase PaaI-like protein